MIPLLFVWGLLQGAGTVSTEPLVAKDLPLREAFALVTRRFSQEFEISPEVAADPVSFRLEKPALFATIEEICRIHGGVRPIFQTFTRVILIRKAPYAATPLCFAGPYLFRLQSISLLQENRFEERAKCALTLDLIFAWSSETPICALVGPPVISRAEDDTGRSLLLASTLPTSPVSPDRVVGRPEIMRRHTLSLEHPAPGAEKLSRVEGTQQILRIDAWTPVSFSKVADDERVSPEGLGVEFRLKSIQLSPGNGTAYLEMTSPSAFRSEEYSWIGAPDRCHDITLVDASGKEHVAGISTGYAAIDRGCIEVQWRNLPAETEFRSLRLRYASTIVKESLPFSFRDLPLPLPR